jgi:hypothetical protein
LAKPITRERAERIARAHACENCREYSFKKLIVRPVAASQRAVLDEAWHATRVCGVCGAQEEMGIDAEGEIVYVS